MVNQLEVKIQNNVKGRSCFFYIQIRAWETTVNPTHSLTTKRWCIIRNLETIINNDLKIKHKINIKKRSVKHLL